MYKLTALLLALLIPATGCAGITTTIEVHQGGSDFAVGRWVSLGSYQHSVQLPECSCIAPSTTGFHWLALGWNEERCWPNHQMSEETLAWSCVDIPDPGRMFLITAHPSENCWTVEECDPE
jgi:hypothetical protein